MSLRLEAVAFDVADPVAVASFWAELLDRDASIEPGRLFLPGDYAQVGLRFARCEAGHVGRPWLHLHLTSTDLDHQQRTVDLALRLGARHRDVGQGPDDTHVVLADPGGNEFCVIEPDNGYLAGTGFLGEVTCDGTREVGLFWRDALGWPLVWDRAEQTAVQSPSGGTKISWDAWDGSPRDTRTGRNRQRFDLVTVDLESEIRRLVWLGATRIADRSDGVDLADPDGNEFVLRAA